MKTTLVLALSTTVFAGERSTLGYRSVPNADFETLQNEVLPPVNARETDYCLFNPYSCKAHPNVWQMFYMREYPKLIARQPVAFLPLTPAEKEKTTYHKALLHNKVALQECSKPLPQVFKIRHRNSYGVASSLTPIFHYEMSLEIRSKYKWHAIYEEDSNEFIFKTQHPKGHDMYLCGMMEWKAEEFKNLQGKTSYYGQDHWTRRDGRLVYTAKTQKYRMSYTSKKNAAFRFKSYCDPSDPSKTFFRDVKSGYWLYSNWYNQNQNYDPFKKTGYVISNNI